MRKILTFLKEKIIRYYNVADDFTIRLEHHHVFLMSAGVAFNILLYLMPMLLMALYVINKIFGVEMIASFLTAIAEEILPPNELSNNMLASTLKEVGMIFGSSSTAGLIGLLSLIWLSSTLFASIRTALNRIFDISTPKIFFIYRVKDIFLTFIISILILLSSYVMPLVSLMVTTLQQNLRPPYSEFFSEMTVRMFSMGVSFLLFFGLFRFVPNKKQPWFIILASTILSVIFLELSRNIFAWYVGKFGTYGKFYGTYAVIVSVAFWIYYSILIILLSGETSRYFYEKVIHPRKKRKLNLEVQAIDNDKNEIPES